jgi:hypothetical protein
LEIEKWQNELIEKSVGMNAEQMLEKLFEVHGHHLIPRAKRELQARIFEISGRTSPSEEERDQVELEKEKPQEQQREKPKPADVNSNSNEQRGDTSRSAEQNSVQQRAGFPKITFVWVDCAGLEPGMFASFENGGRYILTLNKQWAGIEAVLRLLGREASKHEASIRKAAQQHLELLLADAIYSAYEQHEKKLITGKQL